MKQLSLGLPKRSETDVGSFCVSLVSTVSGTSDEPSSMSQQLVLPRNLEPGPLQGKSPFFLYDTLYFILEQVLS